MAVESVSISPEEGLRVDTILANGGTSVPTFFNARGSRYGLFRSADEKMLQGAKVVWNGTTYRVVGVGSGMMDPDGDGSSLFVVVTSDGKTLLALETNSLAGATSETNPTPTGRVHTIEMGAVNAGTYYGGMWTDDWYSYLKGKGLFEISSDGQLVLTATNGVVLGFVAGDVIPTTSNSYDPWIRRHQR